MTFRLGIALALIAGIAALIFMQIHAEKVTPLQPQTTDVDDIMSARIELISTSAQAATRATLPGKQLYTRRCGACHSVDQNRVGPRHRGVYGRKAGTVAGFRYTNALKKLNLTWNESNLDRWLTNPTALAPGTAMGFRLNNPAERKAIIDYLKSVSR